MDTIEAHLAHLVRLNRRPGTIYQRRRTLARLGAFVATAEILELDLDTLRCFVSRGDLAAETIAGEVSNLRGFYRWAQIEGLRGDDPTVRLERPRVPRGLPRPMPEPSAAHALSAAPERIRPWLHFATYAGLRACEIGPLRAEDLVGEVVVVREQKGGDAGVVPLHPVLEPIVAMLPRRGWLFPHRGRGALGPTSAGQVSKLSNRWLHEEGIAHTLHTLRHLFGTRMYRSTRDPRLTQELLRHRSIRTMQIYTALDPAAAVEAVRRLPPVEAA